MRVGTLVFLLLLTIPNLLAAEGSDIGFLERRCAAFEALAKHEGMKPSVAFYDVCMDCLNKLAGLSPDASSGVIGSSCVSACSKMADELDVDLTQRDAVVRRCVGNCKRTVAEQLKTKR